MSTRQQNRQEQRARGKLGQAAIRSGLPTTPDKRDIVGVTQVLLDILSKGGEPDRASRAAELAFSLYDASVKRAPATMALACGNGCSFCCYAWVGATAPEIFLLARVIRRDGSRRGPSPVEIAARCAPTIGLTPQQRFGAKLACPLLVDGRCSHYRERPATCRQTASARIEPCREEFEGRGYGEEMTVSAVHIAHVRTGRLALIAAMRAAGLPATSYELSQALASALTQADAESRWLAGEDVFAGVARAPEEPAPIVRAVNELVAAVVA